MEIKSFPNGFASWHESHFEVVKFLVTTEHYSGSLAAKTREQNGIGALYDLALEITDQFEQLHAGRLWDGDFFDEIEKFTTTYFTPNAAN